MTRKVSLSILQQMRAEIRSRHPKPSCFFERRSSRRASLWNVYNLRSDLLETIKVTGEAIQLETLVTRPTLWLLAEVTVKCDAQTLIFPDPSRRPAQDGMTAPSSLGNKIRGK